MVEPGNGVGNGGGDDGMVVCVCIVIFCVIVLVMVCVDKRPCSARICWGTGDKSSSSYKCWLLLL